MKDRFLVDECVWRSLIEAMRARGWKVRSVREISQGADDSDVLSTALAAEEILVTEDTDFGHLVFFDRKPTFGLLRIPFSRFTSMDGDKARQITDRIAALEGRLAGNITVVEPDRTRQRAAGSGRLL
jgi:predicted nuclease of predicted toxin-antitoxin system